jgi:ribosomal protein L24
MNSPNNGDRVNIKIRGTDFFYVTARTDQGYVARLVAADPHAPNVTVDGVFPSQRKAVKAARTATRRAVAELPV